MIPRKKKHVTPKSYMIPTAPLSTPGSLDWIVCDHCLGRLKLHQPDELIPLRLLGTCSECRRWYLVFLEPASTGGVTVKLPELQPLDDDSSATDPSEPSAANAGPAAGKFADPERVEFTIGLLRRLWARHWPTRAGHRSRMMTDDMRTIRTWLAKWETRRPGPR